MDLIRNVKLICNNVESLTDSNKVTFFLDDDSCFDENNSKSILQSSVTNVKEMNNHPYTFSNNVHLLPQTVIYIFPTLIWFKFPQFVLSNLTDLSFC